MRTGIFGEWLGDISTEALLQNLTNENPHWSSTDSIRLAYPNGFTVTAEMECPVAEDELDQEILQVGIENRLQGYHLEHLQVGKRLVRFVLEPK